ncbi:MAG: hypothetical protein FJ100_07555 [Deltaproteobacteria bacterium]|nr:hypothetical protein [Deltaproteobacteria bacterium]
MFPVLALIGSIACSSDDCGTDPEIGPTCSAFIAARTATACPGGASPRLTRGRCKGVDFVLFFSTTSYKVFCDGADRVKGYERHSDLGSEVDRCGVDPSCSEADFAAAMSACATATH